MATFSSTHQYITLLCVLPFKDNLFNIHGWFINSEFIANGNGKHHDSYLNKVYLTHAFFFSIRNITACLGLGTQHSSPMLGSHFKQWNHQQKVQKCKTVTWKTARRGCLFIGWNKKAELTSVGKEHANYSLLCTCLWMTTEQAARIDFRVMNTFLVSG